MDTIEDKLHDMLIEFQEVNRKRVRDVQLEVGIPESDVKHQRVHPHESVNHLGVPTLDPGVFRALTPMLKARFDYAGEWEMAHAGNDWCATVSTFMSTLEGSTLRRHFWTFVQGTVARE